MRLQWFLPLSPSFSLSSPPLSDCVLPFFTFLHSPDTGPAGADGTVRDSGLWFGGGPSGRGNSTDDACCAPAIQWKRRRAKEEMGTVPGLSPTRPWGQCCQRTVRVAPVVVALLVQLCAAFNLDTEKRVVFTGPPGSYFGYSVEFFTNSSRYSQSASPQSLVSPPPHCGKSAGESLQHSLQFKITTL